MQKPRVALKRILIGLFVAPSVLLLLFFALPHWLIVDESPGKVDAIVVLGGGGGDRLKQGLKLQADNPDVLLVLVGRKPSDWYRNARNCGVCFIDEGFTVFLSGSINTLDDAVMVRNWSKKKYLKRIAVVTDPYHTRRAKIIFEGVFKDLPLDFAMISTGVYHNVVSPESPWWNDRRTVRTILLEFGKILFWPFMARGEA